ncbi:tetratricopeptide repeat protein [Chthonobacter albigriseus]|uniref:tetratricopeptide repeat protein n=1 Tax=Chthonobacter albigriseus TaxID=1683161 RepID=UPI0015EFB3E4|nr:tetratricopeptide repeat protein [Chthonobacter albigriseus]
MADVARLLVAALADHRSGRIDEAADAYCRVLEQDPDNADALHLLGVAMRARGAFDQAIALIRRATRIAPHMVDAWFNLGNALAAAGDPAAAAEAYGTVVALDEARVEAWVARGTALNAAGEPDAAIEVFLAALKRDPANRNARHNLGNALAEAGRPAEAAETLRAVIADHPDLAEAHNNLSHVLLRSGDFATGFAEYEWRWKVTPLASPRRYTTTPEWTGAPFPGRHLVVHAEQGLGDTIQFARLVPLAASLGGEVTLDVHRPLVKLLRTMEGVDVVGEGEAPSQMDLAVPLLGLPHRLGLTLGAVPAKTPYLKADPGLVSAWRDRLRKDERPIVAVAFRGNPASPVDRGRSIADAALLAPLLAVPGIRLISVHKLGHEQLEPVWGGGWRLAEPDFPIEHPGPEFDNGPDAFLDAAALLALADRVVTTDTAIAHLAGALGRPTELMLKQVPDWRWLEGRLTTPWYPAMRLHRQPTRGDWETVVASVATALAGAPPQRG